MAEGGERVQVDFRTEPARYKHWRLSVEGHVATITLNRPHEGNALTTTMISSLSEAWTRVAQDNDIRVAIITGSGERHFCTGASVSGLRTEGEGGLLVGQEATPHKEANRFTPRQCEVWKPVICAVNGLVNGGGLHFVVDADIVIAPQTAVFMDTHVSVGAVGAIENIGLARRATLGAALLLTLVGRDYRMPAERAYQLGLVDLLEPDAAAVMDRARSLAQSMCRNSPQAMALSKRAIWKAEDVGYHEALDHGWELLKSQWNHPDFLEGPKAFQEKRLPKWTTRRS